MSSGYLALILHAHLPFVRHPEHEEFLEEDWLFEAITETYLPLIGMMQRLVRDEVPFQLTMTVTPTLCAMLQDQLLRDRYVRYLDRSIDLAAREMERNRDDEPLRRLSRILSRHGFPNAAPGSWNAEAIFSASFGNCGMTACLEIMATAATHGLLPLLQPSPGSGARPGLDRMRCLPGGIRR